MAKLLFAALLFFLMALFTSASDAKCVCSCVNGQVVPLCDNALDIEPICPPRICPFTPPSVEPINPPRVPPIGTQTCTMKQVYNEWTKRYEWRQVCY